MNPPAVKFAPCVDYSAEAVASALATVVDFTQYIRPGMRVLIKPNLLTDAEPEKAVTTHPEVIRAVIRGVKAAGGVVVVGDSPSSAVMLPQVWEKTGAERVCREEGVELVSLEGEGARIVERDGFTFTLSGILSQVDGVINVCKVKTHVLTALTCGVKNLYGLVPGYQKGILHKEVPTPWRFGRLLKAIADEVKPILTIADGIVAMEGDGPSSGSPMPLGILAVSEDPFALDVALCDFLRIPSKNVPYLESYAATRPELPPWMKALQPSQFKLPAAAKVRPKPKWARRLVRRLTLSPLRWVWRWVSSFLWVRPMFDEKLCVQCGRCVKACPVHILVGRQECLPYLNPPSKCIGCCCCHELCPVKAVHMRQSPLLRLAKAFKGVS